MSEAKRCWARYLKGIAFKNDLNLFDTVTANENFFIGKQWEGVQANGLPTPVFNFLKRVVNFLVASISADNAKIQASPLDGTDETLVRAADAAFTRLFESCDLGGLIRRMLRNAAVDGDGCIYAYWDAEAETGGPGRGDVRCEVIDNTRVFFGNPNDRRVQKQPYILISTREDPEEVALRAKKFRSPDVAAIRGDSDERGTAANRPGDDGKVTVLLQLRRDRASGRILALETTRDALVRPEWDTGLTRYPLTWMSWDEVRDSYHGMAAVTGLIPNQIFVNKLFAMAMISLMTTAYPKVVYDRTRVERWDNRVGAAIGVNGGDVSGVAKIIDPAQISPQISQFIELAIRYTQNFMGATDTALGNVKPENTSAIIAVQRASAIPVEMVKLELYHCMEELGRILLDFMGAYYGRRMVDGVPFDFARLRATPMRLKLDVGASSYWSEIAAVQTLDNLLAAGKLDLADYLERIPDGYIAGKEALLEKARRISGEA